MCFAQRTAGGAKAYYKFSLARGNLITRRGSIEGERALIEAWATPPLSAPSKIRRVLPGKRRLLHLLCFIFFSSPVSALLQGYFNNSEAEEKEKFGWKASGRERKRELLGPKQCLISLLRGEKNGCFAKFEVGKRVLNNNA